MDKEGEITVHGKNVTVVTEDKCEVHATGDVTVQSAANVLVKGTHIHMN